MAQDLPQPPSAVSQSKITDPNGILPGTTFPGKANATSEQESQPAASPPAVPGPEVDSQPTTMTIFTPAQLAASTHLEPLYHLTNLAFAISHEEHGHINGVSRYKNSDQLIAELGAHPGTFTYVLCFADSGRVIGAASGKHYAGTIDVVEAVPAAKEGQENGVLHKAQRSVFKRVGAVPQGTQAWEMAGVAVDPEMQRRGLASFLMTAVEEEVKRRFRAAGGSEKLVMMLTTVKEIRGDFYGRRGYVVDYDTSVEKGVLGSERGFHVTHMSKVAKVADPGR